MQGCSPCAREKGAGAACRVTDLERQNLFGRPWRVALVSEFAKSPARDWAGELVNQVLGRVKNRMRAVGLTFDVSAPAALSGQALSFAKPKSEQTRPMLFDAHPDRVWFWLDAQWSSEVEPNVPPGRQRKEGEVILF